MFHLDREVDLWCGSLRLRRKAAVEELKDHLYCKIDSLIEKGLSEKQAFTFATEEMGNLNDLRKEYDKNKLPKEFFCYVAAVVLAGSGLVHLTELYEHVVISPSGREATKDVFIGGMLLLMATYKYFHAERKRKRRLAD